MAKSKSIGIVTHFYNKIGVAIIKFSKSISVGTKIKIKGTTTDFDETIKSMQFDHKPIESAKKGQEVGIKIDGKVHEGDEIFEIE